MSVDDSVRNSDAPLDRFAASRDLWPGGTLDAWQGRGSPEPDRIWWPESADAVYSVLVAAADAGVSVVPYGAGSGVSGGARGKAGSWVIDTKALQAIGPLDEARGTVRCAAGVNGQHLEDWLNERGFTLGHSPSSIWCSTVGGWAAARGAGQFSSLYGVFEDMVLSLQAVAPGVGVFEVGQDGDAPAAWMDQLLGSEGTLGVVTAMTLRVRRSPEHRWLRGYRFATVEEALLAMRQLMQEELWPSVVRLYDPVDTRIGGKTKPKKAHKSDGFALRWLKAAESLPGVRQRTLALPLALPGLVNRILNGLASGCLLIVGFEGRSDVVEASAGHARSILDSAGGQDLGEEPGWRWFHSRHAVSYKLMPVFERGGFADTMEVAARWSQLPGLYEAIRAAVRPYAVVMAHMSHVYPEGACIYFSFAGRGDRSVYDALWQAALQAVLAAGGTVSHHHGVGELKAKASSIELGAAAKGYWALRGELDPARSMNPGRVVVEVPAEDVGLPLKVAASDGVLRVPVQSSLDEREAIAAAAGVELMWPFEQVAGPPRWHRSRWHQVWTEVRGHVDGVACCLGRGPRSASGPDLRGWLAEQEGSQAAVAVVALGERWFGTCTPTHPWEQAQMLLAAGLRPAVLTVVEGVLWVGFRGKGAASFGQIASDLLGGVEPGVYRTVALPSGPLEPCEATEQGVCWVTEQGCFRRAS